MSGHTASQARAESRYDRFEADLLRRREERERTEAALERIAAQALRQHYAQRQSALPRPVDPERGRRGSIRPAPAPGPEAELEAERRHYRQTPRQHPREAEAPRTAPHGVNPEIGGRSYADHQGTVTVPGAKAAQDEKRQARLTHVEAELHPTYALEFDGNQLTMMRNGRIYATWPAVSGAPGHQDPSHQHLVDKGPIPEGVYHARQNEYQNWNDLSVWQKLFAPFDRGPWPGGTPAWGEHRVWLRPDIATDTLGRDGFSIHGGWEPGSAGCIDLTNADSLFARMFRAAGEDMALTVRYGSR